jgi:predicted Rossmann fold nucleotide-binding protein DprA/Smf involved in DNA uptake
LARASANIVQPDTGGESVEDHSEQILAELRTQTQWLRVLALPTLRATVDSALNTTRKRSVFELTTGDLPIKEISASTGASVGSISAYWAEWERLGIVAQTGRRYVKIASLASLGLSPAVPEPAPEAKAKEKR